jgi:iduronate 2-sulfatase
MGYTMRTGRWRYTEWIDRKTKEVRARELYDHDAGPLETVNLAGRPEHKGTVEKLARMLKAGWRAAQPPRRP